MTKRVPIIIVTGPTGVGKTDHSYVIAQRYRGQVINADSGQFLTPLTIGTGKPDWRNKPIAHYLFDIIDEPRKLTVWEYREQVLELIEKIGNQGKIPIIVGGSLFYIKSLLFPPKALAPADAAWPTDVPEEQLWPLLNSYDPVRAAALARNDIYRLRRALAIKASTGINPSELVPTCDPPGPFFLIGMTRARHDLEPIIINRITSMIERGWLDEIDQLVGTSWEQFAREHNIIGYKNLFDYRSGPQTERDFARAILEIVHTTRDYARRQMTFWRGLERQINDAYSQHSDQLPRARVITWDASREPRHEHMRLLEQFLREVS